jgi:hypothetical protein
MPALQAARMLALQAERMLEFKTVILFALQVSKCTHYTLQ